MAQALKGRRVALLRNDKIGDLVLALPLCEALHEAGAEVGVLASPYAAPILEGDPRVASLMAPAPGQEAAALAKGGFDCGLCLWASWANAWALWRAGVPQRLGPSARSFSPLFNRRLPLRRGQGLAHESELNLAYAAALGADNRPRPPRLRLPPEDRRRAAAELKRLMKGQGAKGPLLILHPGSKGSAQNWPPARYGALGLALRKRFGARVLVSGGPGDEAAVAECGAVLGRAGARMREALPLRVFAALAGLADLFVSASTGPMHLAAAQGAPSLSLFPARRSMSPLRWGPRGNAHAVLSPAGLGWRAPESVDGVARISVDEAVQAAGFLLERR